MCSPIATAIFVGGGIRELASPAPKDLCYWDDLRSRFLVWELSSYLKQIKTFCEYCCGGVSFKIFKSWIKPQPKLSTPPLISRQLKQKCSNPILRLFNILTQFFKNVFFLTYKYPQKTSSIYTAQKPMCYICYLVNRTY